MMQSRPLLWRAVLFAAVSCWTTAATARCNITAAALTISPVTASTGTYNPPTAPTAQSVTFTVSGSYNSTTAANPLCTVGLSFNRASLPASMARTTGGATMPYTITSLAGGGNTLLFTGGGLPALTNLVTFSFPQAGLNLNNQPFSINLTAFFLAQPGSPQGAGNYSDALTANIYNVRQGNNALTLRASRAFSVTGAVSKACTIGGLATPVADTATIPVSAAGVVNITAIAKSYLAVQCNVLSNLQVTSQGGAVKRTGAAPSGFSNLIDYSATSTFGGAMSSLNTAAVATAVGAEAGTIGTTSSATPSGILSVTITPQSAATPLVKGSYADTLRITIIPQ
jgi:hypothetical protein